MNALQRRRAGAAALAALLTTTVLAGCSGGPEESASGPVDLTMALWSSNEAHLEVFNQIADAYIAEHEDTVSSITFEPLSGGDYITALTTQIAGGDSPDLAWVFEANAREFIEQGVLTDLSTVFEETEGYDADDLLPGAMEVWTDDGRPYAYPFSSSPMGIYVNLDLINAAGQPNPRQLLADGEWTWDRLMEISAAVAASNPAVGGFGPGKPYEQWNDSLSMMWKAWGVSAWSEDGKACTLDSPEAVDFFTWYRTNVFETGAIPGPGEVHDFATGQLAASLGQMSRSGPLVDATFAWDYLPMPEGPEGAVPVIGQAGVGVIERSENKEVAADFLAYFTNPENAALLAQFFPPPRESLLEVDIIAAAAPQLTPEQIEGTVIAQADGQVKDGHVNMNSLLDRVRAGLDAMWAPDADVEAVLTDVCADIEPILAK